MKSQLPLSKEEKESIPLPKQLLIIPVDQPLFPGAVIRLNIRVNQKIDFEKEKLIGFVLINKQGKFEEIGTMGVMRGGLSSNARSSGNYRKFTVVGIRRFRIKKILQSDPFYLAQVEKVEETINDQGRANSLVVLAKQDFLDAIKIFQEVEGITHRDEEIEKMAEKLKKFTNPGELADFIIVYLIDIKISFSLKEKQALLAALVIDERLEKLVKILEEIRLGLKMEIDLGSDIQKEIREKILTKQIEILKKEMGKGNKSEVEYYLAKAKEAKLPEHVEEVFNRELDNFSQTNPLFPEYNILKTWLDLVVYLPWSNSTEDRVDIEEAEKILEQDHYGLKRVKERVLEFLAVRMRKSSTKGPILCFIGPPGTGKTSVGQSIARAMGRKFIRISLGGVYDESHLRGHRRTYVGALPGIIIQRIREVGCDNPVFMIDEIDKIGTGSFHGDPSSALLEILDPEQNNTFSDRYLDIPFDLSKVMFITTGNTPEFIQPALKDRMEIINFPSYTREEKLEIAKRYLIPKQFEQNALKANEIQFEPGALEMIIKDYTDEAGVRKLEQVIGNICRKTVFRIAKQILSKVVVTKDNLIEFLGPPKYFWEIKSNVSRPGVAIGLAWTPCGGSILFIETVLDKGVGKSEVILTGHLGEVMKESALTAISYIRVHLKELGIEESDYPEKSKIHIHVPQGATPKDGPSAGIAIFASLVSLLLKKNFRNDVAVTGEISLRGVVLPVGGILEKVLAAKEAGIKTVVLPKGNEKDLWDFPSSLKKALEEEEFAIKFIEKMEEIIPLVLEE